ncbi:MAG: hypothetical protein C4532_05085 [Candidatus Abyssobacteria bacterium SURF_17]|uniref:Type II secretion system protein GspG C-terminal domain-containing protein n=1 Tax=Candidatus Abyssobacteria bacterium SURF_17 TaxID=2093361 RepID=A0A419F3I9_9BACT|nr:MAG: hypothetical protein C4532_05085 [Candidatus Abyssubacteria bacterium SURF_17]
MVSATRLSIFYPVNLSYMRGIIQLRGTRLKAAVELYQRRHGRYPEDLNSLVSDGILKAIPIDPYSEGPFRYSENIIYSVGTDREDGRGEIPMTPREVVEGKPGDIVF